MRSWMRMSMVPAVGAVLVLTGCGGGGGGPAVQSSPADNPFSAAVSGTLKTSGFNPGDEVGKSR